MNLPSFFNLTYLKNLSMIDQNDFKSIVPGHRFNPPPFLCPLFLTITFSIVGKDWYQCQICAELSRLQHQRAGPECIWFYCRKGQHLEWGGIILSQLGRGERGEGASLGKREEKKEEGYVQVRREETQESVLVIQKDKRSSVPTADKGLTPVLPTNI